MRRNDCQQGKLEVRHSSDRFLKCVEFPQCRDLIISTGDATLLV
jgi:hypothetical protein